MFTIDANTGVVTVNGAMDAETASSYDITVRADSTDGSFATRTFTIAINDVDEFDVGAVTDVDVAANAVDENSAVGTSVGITASASDADATTNAITYTLDDSAGGLFAIDANTGVVTVAGALDAETATSHNITVRATSDDSSFSTQNFTININDLDEFDVGAVVDTDATANTVAEDAAVGTAVGITASASDADVTDGVTYSLSDDAGGRFAIDANTGVITVNAALDYETNTSHNVTVLATSDDSSTSSQVFTINVTDVNESGASAISDTDASADSVDENSAIGTGIGVTAFADDPDATDTITYSLTDDAGGLFTIDANTGVVTVNGALDAETATSHDITVRADSTDGSFTTRTFTIGINDVDEFDVGAVVDTDAATNAVDENAIIGSTVGVTASATDSDVTDNIIYTLDDSAGGLFAIDANTGVVTVAGALDAETATSHNITVRATSDDSSFSTQSFTININDLDEFDVGAVVDTDASANTVAEDAVVGTAVGVTALATDNDVTDGVTYSLSDDASGRFAIDANTGVITVNAALDYETNTSHNVTVLATSDDSSTSSQAFTINVSDVDEFDVSAISDTDVSVDDVDENSAVGTSVGVTAFASDGDGSNNTISYSLIDSAGGLFTIDANTGVVTVNGALDAETASSYDITIRADSTDGSFATRTFTIGINDVDEFDVGAVTDVDVAANAVDENAVLGTSVGITASATDADATTNAITYTLDDSAGGLFAIDANTGVVTLAGALDAETATSHNITVRATSDDASFNTQSFTININDLDEFDVGAVVDTDASANAVDENASVGSTVGITANASDADATTNAITYTLDDSAGGLFAIDANTGVVTVAGALDAETATSHTITVRATSDDASFNTQSFTININDLDEFDVGAVVDTDATVNTVAEDASVGTSVGITANASDSDVTDNVSYSLTDDAGGRFAIDANTGVITVNAALDYEANTSHSVTALATSDDGSTASQIFTINVTDVDEFNLSALTDNNPAADSVAENSAVGTTVGITAFADDPDGTDTVSYFLDDNASGLFSIDANTGVVTVAGALDAETATSYNIIVRGLSTDGSFSVKSFTIAINDVDEFDIGAVNDVDAAINAVDENASVGSTVGITASATDSDVTDTIIYTLDDNAGGLFAIDANTGVVTVAGALDAETATSHNITVRATSDDASFSTQSFTININDLDEFDVGAVVDTDASANSVAENAGVGTAVGVTANASDADVTDNVTYSLTDDAGGRFAIDTNTGVITVNAALDYETNTSHNVTVLATSDDSSTSSQSFTINVSDVDEFDVSAISDTDVAADAVDENSAVGTSVGVTAFASDGDGSNNTISYSLTDSAGGLFTIDANTGVVTVNGSLDAETASSYDITVLADSTDGSFAIRTFTIAVNDVNEAPLISPIADQVINEDSSTGALAFTVDDPESAAGTLSITVSSSDQSIIPNANLVLGGSGASRTLTVTPAPDQNGGPVTITVTVSDGVYSRSETFSVTVTPVNDTAVIAGIDASSVSEDTGVVAGMLATGNTLTVSDTDSGESSFIAGTLSGTYGTLTIDTVGNWSYTADNSQAAIQGLGVTESLTDLVTITSFDGTSHDITVTLTGTNDVPVVNNDSYAVTQGTTFNTLTAGVLANDYDIDGDALIATLITGPGNGVLTLNADGTFSYASDANFIGNDSFTYQVSDGHGGIVSNTVTLTVSNLPEGLPATDDNGGSDADTVAKDLVDDVTLLASTDTQEIASDPEGELLFIDPADVNLAVNPVESLQAITEDTTKGDIQGVQDYYRDRLYDFQDDRFDRSHVSLAEHTFKVAYDTVSDMHIKVLEMLSEYQLEIQNRHHTNMPLMQLFSKTAGGATLSLTAGILAWTLRGGALAATMLSSMPIWKGFDPLPVLSAARKKYRKAADSTIEDANNELIDEMFDTSGNSTSESEDTHHD